MTLNDKQRNMAIIGAIIVSIGVYYTIRKTGDPGTNTAGNAPRHESGTASSMNLTVQSLSSDVNMLGVSADGSLSWASRLLHTFHPIDHVAPNCDYKVYLPHRYPTHSGTNVNTLIHHGYSALMVPSSRDYDWFTRPPGDDEFAGAE